MSGGDQIIFYKDRELSGTGISLRFVRGKLEGRIGRLALSSGGIPIPLNQWIQVTFVYSRGEGRLFVNGSEVAYQQRNEKWMNKDPLIIGAFKEQTNRGRDGFRGIIDEIRFSVIIPHRKYDLPNNVNFVIGNIPPPQQSPPQQQPPPPPQQQQGGTQAAPPNQQSPQPQPQQPQTPPLVINIDAEGRLDARYHIRPVTFRIYSETESKVITIGLDGSVSQ